MDRTIALFASDPALLSSLHFSLSLEGFEIRTGSEATGLEDVVVIDQNYNGDGVSFLNDLRASGFAASAILLVTHPRRTLRILAQALGARLVEKPLDGNDLAEALADIFNHRFAA